MEVIFVLGKVVYWVGTGLFHCIPAFPTFPHSGIPTFPIFDTYHTFPHSGIPHAVFSWMELCVFRIFVYRKGRRIWDWEEEGYVMNDFL